MSDVPSDPSRASVLAARKADLDEFWIAKRAEVLEVSTTKDIVKLVNLPQKTISKIVKRNEDVSMIANDVPFLIAAATRLFCSEWARRGTQASQRKRVCARTIRIQSVKTHSGTQRTAYHISHVEKQRPTLVKDDLADVIVPGLFRFASIHYLVRTSHS